MESVESDALTNYIDLTDGETLSGFRIVPGDYNCEIIGPDGIVYCGFLLAKTPGGNAYTLCDVDFQWSRKDSKYAPRLTFRKTNKNLEDKPINKGHRIQRIPFSSGNDGYREFWRMIGFLAKFKETVDLGDDFYGFQAVGKDAVVTNLKDKGIAERKQEIIDYVTEADLSLEDMAGALHHRSRADDLEELRKLLTNEDGYRDIYRAKHSIKAKGNEVLFHHFLKSRKWIFGLNLDIKLIDSFSDKAAVGKTNTSGTGEPRVDMLGWNDYTVLVELKTPDAKFFTETKSSTARSNTWSFTPDFFDGYSQVLAQREDWIANHKSKDMIQEADGVKSVVDQGVVRTIDPRTIFLYGNKDLEMPPDAKDISTIVKRDTLERLSRDNRNVMILSYDELYRRAYYIVYGKFPARLPKPKPPIEIPF